MITSTTGSLVGSRFSLEDETMSFAETIRAAIRADGRSLLQVAKACGVSDSQLSRFMRGLRSIDLETAEKICRTLRISLSVENAP